MRRVMVRYTVRPDAVEENERYVRDVFAQLERDAPPGIRYATFKLDDGVSFVHIASIETDDGSNPLFGLEAFKTFSSTLAQRAVGPPVSTDLTEVGAFRVF